MCQYGWRLYCIYFIRYIVSSESGNLLIWNRITEQVLFKEEQIGIRQLVLLEGGAKVLAMSKPLVAAGAEVPPRTIATGIVRTIPGNL